MKRPGLIAFVFALVVVLSAGRSVCEGAEPQRPRDRALSWSSTPAEPCGSRSIDAKGSMASDSNRQRRSWTLSIPRSCRAACRDEGARSRREARSGVAKPRERKQCSVATLRRLRHTRLQFDSLVIPDGNTLRICRRVKSIAENVSRQVAASPKSRTSRVRTPRLSRSGSNRAIHRSRKERPAEGLGLVQDCRTTRSTFRKGTVYTIELLEPLNFGVAVSPEWAPEGTMPPPESVLEARLITALDSMKTPRGTPS